MKGLVIVLFLFMAGTCSRAQTMDTVLIVQKARKFNTKEHILLLFELLDTLDASGRKVTFSRSYYFDKKQRKISSVRQYDNPKKPERGTQVIYSFTANKLTAVTVIPSKSTCTHCASEYHFSGDTLSLNGDSAVSDHFISLLIDHPKLYIERRHAELFTSGLKLAV